MSLRGVVARAKRGFREEIRLYLVAITSLVVAFLCLGAALLALQNLDAIAERFGESRRVTVYLSEGVDDAEAARLAAVLEGLREVASVRTVSSAEAREDFLSRSGVGADLEGLTPDLFPASIELGLSSDVGTAELERLTVRVGALEGVSDVESYRGWFERLGALLEAGRIFAVVLGILVGVGVFAVVGNTVRLSIARRAREIEVMKLCGATHGFVRGPFLLEGIVQGALASGLAIALLALGFFSIRSFVDGALSIFLGMKLVFLGPGLLAALLAAGALIGAASSALSLRRHLEV